MNADRALIFRGAFGLGAASGVALAGWVLLWPESFFTLFEVEPERARAAWTIAGALDGFVGIAFAYAALRPERARRVVASGLAWKVLGPLGWLLATGGGVLPLRTVPLVALDGVAWWLPCALFLLEGTTLGARLRASAPYTCAALNLLAALALLLALRPGTELVSDAAQRTAYIRDNALAWRGGWSLWIGAAVSLFAFYAWWATRLSPRVWWGAALLVATCGIVADVVAESLLIGWLPERYAEVAPLAFLLTGAVANGLYTIAGAVLTLRTELPGALRAWTWAVWASGAALSASALAQSPLGVAASTAVLFALFVPWCVALGRRLS